MRFLLPRGSSIHSSETRFTPPAVCRHDPRISIVSHIHAGETGALGVTRMGEIQDTTRQTQQEAGHLKSQSNIAEEHLEEAEDGCKARRRGEEDHGQQEHARGEAELLSRRQQTDVHVYWDLDNKRPELDPVGVLDKLK